MTLQALAPAFPGAEKSYAVLMRYGYRQPAVKNFPRPRLTFPGGPEYPKTWQDHLIKHRAEIETGWATLAPVGAWLEELRAFDRIADLSESFIDAEEVSNALVRSYAYHAMAVATQQALDGHGDEALATLQPMLEVGGKLLLSSRGPFHFALARSLQRWAITAARFVIDNSVVSSAARARFDAVLVARGGGPAGMRHYYAIQYAEVVESTPSFGRAVAYWTAGSLNFMRWAFDGMGPVVFNRRATLNRFGDLFADLRECGAQRDAGKARQRIVTFLAPENRPLFKNPGGAWLNDLILGESSSRNAERTIQNYWAIEDRRTELHAALTKP
jgi:hypothetical protein